MAPHGSALPKATTESAKAARQNFFCELCQKGYARMPDFEAHEGSYDHQHRKRLKEMKQLTRGTGTSSSRSKGSGELQTISLPSTTNSSKKQPGFSAVGQPAAPSNFIPLASGLEHDEESGEKGDDDDQSGAVRNGWASEAYDPAFVSGCGSECRACGGQGGSIAV